jgi:hypothetical protein
MGEKKGRYEVNKDEADGHDDFGRLEQNRNK